MGKFHKHQKGQSSQAGFLGIHSVFVFFVVLTVIGAVYWMVLNRSTAESSKSTPKKTQSETTTADAGANYAPQIYHDSDGGFSFSYPSGWQIASNNSGTGTSLIKAATLTSPSGSIRTFITFQKSYTPSVCIPDYYDKPFLTTNRCFSAEYLSVTELPIKSYQKTGNSVMQTAWYLTHYHFRTITINQRELYESCLVIGKPVLNKAEMGFFEDHPKNELLNADGSTKGYLSACVEAGSTPADYQKSEAVSGETILRSLRFDD